MIYLSIVVESGTKHKNAGAYRRPRNPVRRATLRLFNEPGQKSVTLCHVSMGRKTMSVPAESPAALKNLREEKKDRDGKEKHVAAFKLPIRQYCFKRTGHTAKANEARPVGKLFSREITKTSDDEFEYTPKCNLSGTEDYAPPYVFRAEITGCFRLTR